MRWTFIALSSIAALALAQDSTSTDFSAAPTDSSGSAATTSYSSVAVSSTTETSTTSEPVTHTIEVAKGGHTFVPDVVLADKGDTIVFLFYPTNHSVVRAEYGYPCIPYEDTGVDKVGFFSGFKPVDAILPEPPTWSIVLNDTDPIFYYCGAPGSCIDYQMVGVINPNATTSLQQQKDLASQSQFMLLPGQPWPEEGENPFTTTTSAAPTSSPTSAPAATSSAAAAPTSSSNHSSLSPGAIAGIAIGAAAVVLAAAVLLYICGRKSARQRNKAKEPSNAHGPANMHQMPYNAHVSMAPSYMDPTKHMSLYSSVAGVSPALPGYMPYHDPNMSPPMHGAPFPMSDSLALAAGQGSDIAASPNNASPNPMYSAPAYSSAMNYGVPGMAPPIPTSSPVPMNVHEMPASSDPSQQQHLGQQGGGFPNSVNRQSSVSKSSGVERYT
ncbi:hypothetical protein PV05_12010 [Exophiala xenobiotica]|uniref:Phytocyanin domain-containing protein n=1 Tax=Exophiala xenobiotica TaxID=348802 RepID=A0A0D2CKT2_9EURO|nr:uncharacterized protein PV05_12010 [Exophiala xenobiotica]KIW50422.1 hypothetical protein PV05_12010 [Exophiala xenobiotica]